jgi:hypothetical protein
MHLWELLSERADTRSRKLYRMVQEKTDHEGAFARPLRKGWILEIDTNPNSTINMYAYENAQALSMGKFVESAEDYEIGNLETLVRAGMAQPYNNRTNESVINELFNQPVPYQLQDTGDMVHAAFVVGDLRYLAYFAKGSRGGQEFWDFTFEFIAKGDADRDDDNSGVDNTGHGSEFVVFATVLSIMQEFISKHKPEVLKFSGDKSNGRSKLYRIMAGKLKNQIARMGYHVEEKELYGASYFTMTRNDVSEGIFSSKKAPPVPADRLRHASLSTQDRRDGADWMGTNARAKTRDEDKPPRDAVYREPKPRTFGKRGA